MSKATKDMLEGVKLGTCKLFDLDNGQVHVIAVSSDELFGKADTILVSKDRKTWIQHGYDEFMDAVNNGKEIKVA